MFTDEQLCMAAMIAGDIYADSLPDDCDHIFSPRFHKRMERLIWRVNHPITHKSLKSVACLFLTFILTGTLILAFNAEVRAIAWGWLIEQYESFYQHYFYEGNTEIPSDTSAGYPTWIPSGYTEDAVIDMGESAAVIYTNDAGQLLRFYYSMGTEDVDLFIETDGVTRKIVYLGTIPADLYLSDNENIANNIVWMNPENQMMYYISGFLNEDDLVKMAESVRV